MNERALTVEQLDAYIGRTDDADLQPYLDAAAVLAAFDPVALNPLGGSTLAGDPVLFDRLLPLCEPNSSGPHQGLWSLLLAERRAALERLAKPAAMLVALAANPTRPDSPAQKVFELLVAERLPPLQKLPREDLAALFTVSAWLRGILDVPEEETLRAALARWDLTAPMRRLVPDGFVNRVEELRHLAEYMSLPGGEPPLFVHGTGGVGKSTLLARFLLTDLDSGRACAYLDIDRPTLRPDDPITLVLEMLDQLAVQLPLKERGVEALSQRIAEQTQRMEQSRASESFAGAAAEIVLSRVEPILDGPWPAPLVVVDTFEEAQFLGPDVVETLSDFLVQLVRTPNLKVIVAGRALPDEFLQRAFADVTDPAAVPWPQTPIDLGVLDRQPAQELLQRSIQRNGLPPLTREELDQVIDLVSSNPMCLRLAARLLAVEGVERLRTAQAEVYAQLRAEKIQALLYGRILSHVHDEDVKKIAYPGLIVRRITPEVIREVLAGPCKLELTPAREYDLFRDLAKEAALVEPDLTDGSLRHRTDVRRVMLEDLTDHVRADVVEAIDSAAIDFYAAHPPDDHVARAEEIYHRLRRRDPEATLDERWLPGAADLLKTAGDELPAQGRIWLAERLGRTLDPWVRERADQEAWESQAARSAQRYLQGRRPERALHVLHERHARLPRSALHLLELEAHRMAGEFDEAGRVGRAGVDALTTAGAIDMALELLLAMVGIEEAHGDPAEARKLVEEAKTIASHSANDVLKLRTDITAIRVERRLHPEQTEAQAERHQDAVDLTPELRHELRSLPVLLREVAAELASDPAIASLALETLGVEVESDEQARALGRALTTLTGQIDFVSRRSGSVIDAVDEIKKSDYEPAVIRKFADRMLTGRETREIARGLRECPPGTPALLDFREYLRAGVDSSLRGSSDWSSGKYEA